MKIAAYEILGELGRGGMGVVYRVRTPRGDEAALKVLKKVDPGTLARFERERRLLASLGEEAGFVGLLEAGSSPEGAWLLMPLVPGGTLRDRLAAGALGPEVTVALGVRLAEALGAAHERGVVHRDVKPENVLFTRDGRPLLADLGLAKHFDPGATGASLSVNLTGRGAFTGTVGYMAPEQLEDAASVGPPADVFALGAVLYECLAGHPVFEGETLIEVLAKVSAGTVEPIGNSRVPPWLEAVVFRALARDPRERFAQGRSLAMALRGVPEPSSPGAGSVAKRAPRGLVPSLVLGSSLGALALLAGIATLVHGGKGGAPPGPRSAVRWPAPEAPSGSAAELVVLAREKLLSDLNGAISDLDRAITLDPKLAVAWQLRGLARTKKGDYAGAITDATRALELDPALASAWTVRGAGRGGTRDVDGLVADCTKAIELDPRLAEAWQLRSAARRAKGDLEGAIADATKTIELDPTSASARLERSAARALARDWAGVIADTSKAIELAPGAATVWQNRAAARAFSGDPDGAIADATKAIELDPRLASAWSTRASVLLGGKNEPGPAIADFTKAIELDPTSAESWRGRGQARASAGDLDGAIEDSTRALELEPGSAGVWTDRGVHRGLSGDREGALADFTRAIELNPGLANAWAQRGSMRLACGLVDAAIADDTRAIELDPGLALGWKERGIARGKRGDLDGAIADLSRAIELDATRSVAWGSRGSARYMKGDFRGAIGDFERTLELDPQGEHAAEIRTQLDEARKRAP